MKKLEPISWILSISLILVGVPRQASADGSGSANFAEEFIDPSGGSCEETVKACTKFVTEADNYTAELQVSIERLKSQNLKMVELLADQQAVLMKATEPEPWYLDRALWLGVGAIAGLYLGVQAGVLSGK